MPSNRANQDKAVTVTDQGHPTVVGPGKICHLEENNETSLVMRKSVLSTCKQQRHSLGQSFFLFCFTDFFRNKLVSEDEIKIKTVFPSILIQLENGPNEFYFTN